MSIRMGSLCSGYEGLGMAAQAVIPDAELAWVSDIDKGACKVLAHRYPAVPNLGDMTAVDWAVVEPVDIITGGTPCQDLSHAGKRAGMTEGTRSNLWVSMREAIATIRPRLVVWENVQGAGSADADSDLEFCAGCMGEAWYRGPVLRALGRVVGDLADLGYVGQVRGLRAADVGAPHGRFRYFLAAHPADADYPRPRGAGGECGRGTRAQHSMGDGTLLPTPVRGDGERAPTHYGRGNMTLAGALLLTPAVNDMGEGKTPDAWDEWTAKMQAAHGNGNGHGKSLAIEAQRLLPTPKATNNENRCSDDFDPHKTKNFYALLNGMVEWGEYAPAIARWEALTRPAPPPTQPSKKGTPQLSAAFSEWMMGLPAGWITDVPGITRNEALRLAGNGVVWQQAAAALRIMLARAEVAA